MNNNKNPLKLFNKRASTKGKKMRSIVHVDFRFVFTFCTFIENVDPYRLIKHNNNNNKNKKKLRNKNTVKINNEKQQQKLK